MKTLEQIKSDLYEKLKNAYELYIKFNESGNNVMTDIFSREITTMKNVITIVTEQSEEGIIKEFFEKYPNLK